MKLKEACSLEKKAMTNLDSILKSRNITLPTKVFIAKATVFPAVLYEYESAKELMLLNCDAVEQSWESVGLQVWLTADQISQSVGDHSWIFIGRTDAEAEGPDAKNWLIVKDADSGKDWRLEEKSK